MKKSDEKLSQEACKKKSFFQIHTAPHAFLKLESRVASEPYKQLRSPWERHTREGIIHGFILTQWVRYRIEFDAPFDGASRESVKRTDPAQAGAIVITASASEKCYVCAKLT